MMITFKAERIYRSQQSERFKLTIAGTNSTIILQTNRPATEIKKNNKTTQWHIIEGAVFNKAKLENMYQQLEKAIHHQPASFQGTLNFIDHF